MEQGAGREWWDGAAGRVRWLALAFLAAILLLKCRYLAVLSVNSDEPQHLHVAWAWSQGLVAYRDVFDNHAPLFHLLSAPLLALLGERADIVLWMRVPMLALWLGMLGATWLLRSEEHTSELQSL